MVEKVAHGYKAFNCSEDGILYSGVSNYIFKVGSIYTEKKAVLCRQGFHYCTDVRRVFNYCPYNSVVCKVTDLSIKDTQSDGRKCCTTKLKIDYILDGIVDGVYFRNGRLHSPEDGNHAICMQRPYRKVWCVNGLIHRDGDLPAFLARDEKMWYKYGKIHREGDLPACITLNSDGKPVGHKWWKNGKRHRDGDLPAVDWNNGVGDKEWWKNGKRHRDGDLPAIEQKDGYRAWYKEGEKHRDGGLPAVEFANGEKEWWQNGKQISPSSLNTECIIL